MTVIENAEERIVQQAAAWDARLRALDCSIQDRDSFKAWRQADAANARAYDSLQGGLAALRLVRETDDVRQWRRDIERQQVLAGLGRKLGLIAASVAVLGVAISLILGHGAPSGALVGNSLPASPGARSHRGPDLWQAVYKTPPGQRATIALPDGSSVTLDARSVLRVAYERRARRLVLQEGRALFDVAHDPGRPFVVSAGGFAVTAVGTAFDIRVNSRSLKVDMVRGVARVNRLGHTEDHVIHLGQQFAAGADVSPDVRNVDVPTETGWTQGRVLLDETPLADAVEEIGRYLPQPVHLQDDEMGALRINGAFRTNRPEDFFLALERLLPVTRQVESDGAIRLVWRRSGKI